MTNVIIFNPDPTINISHRTCSCSRGWTGGACDVCSTTNCPVKSSVLYILPSTADQEDTNTVVNVYGIEFPKTSSGVYICIFGSLSSEGRRVTSSLVRCPLPVNVTLGRHLFNIAPQGSISVIPNLDVRPPDSVYRINSSIPNLHFDSSRGILEWAEPGLTSVPILLKIREEASKDVEEIILASDTHGQFSYEFTPKKEGKYGAGRGGLLFLAESPGWNGEIVSSVQCDSNRKELFRHYPQPLGTPGVYAIPSSIAIVNQGNKSKTFEVTIYTSGVYLRSPMSIRTADNTQPFFLIATDPDIDKITENSNYHHIKISLGLNVEEEFRNGSIEIVSGREVLLRIPYVYLSMSSDRFDVTLCLRDGTHTYGVFADATIVLSVTNTALGVDYISPLNTSFCITLQAIDIRSIPAEENEVLYMSELKEGHITTLPHVEFSPSSVNSSTESIIVRVKGTMGGLVSLDNVDNSFVRLVSFAFYII
uniref:EGF-like domain-containing protein n=1 Tax=Heterorhabditis bacteriophora TaxID=37862 RepID=A0A1I7XMI7_HETBA